MNAVPVRDASTSAAGLPSRSKHCCLSSARPRSRCSTLPTIRCSSPRPAQRRCGQRCRFVRYSHKMRIGHASPTPCASCCTIAWQSISRTSKTAPGSASGSRLQARCVSAGGCGSVQAVSASMRPDAVCASSSTLGSRLEPARMPTTALCLEWLEAARARRGARSSTTAAGPACLRHRGAQARRAPGVRDRHRPAGASSRRDSNASPQRRR